jgi:hypothetical protein
MRGFRRIIGAVILLAATLPAYADDALVALVIEDGGSEAERAAADGGFTESLVSEVERVFRSRGMEIIKPEGAEPEEIPRWSIHIHCSLESGMLSWWFELRDDQRGTLVTADAFSAAAGLSVRDSWRTRWTKWRHIGKSPAPRPRQKCLSPIDLSSFRGLMGASVISRLGGGRRPRAMQDTRKSTEAEYIALV